MAKLSCNSILLTYSSVFINTSNTLLKKTNVPKDGGKDGVKEMPERQRII